MKLKIFFLVGLVGLFVSSISFSATNQNTNDPAYDQARQDYRAYLQQLKTLSSQYKQITGEVKKVIQEEGVRLFEATGNEDTTNYMRAHRDTIARFGRFPFRNAALGRQSTPEEEAYMREQDGRAF